MIKQYFADGLISIAIILSLLRTDINQYLNNSLINYPEIHDIILGTSTAYTQTNFHNNLINNIGGYSVHPKSIEHEYLASSVLGELRCLSRFRRFHGLNTDISAFLVNPPTSFVPHATSAETQSPALNPSESAASDVSLGSESGSPSEDVNNNVGTVDTASVQVSESVGPSGSDSADSDVDGAFALPSLNHVLTDPFTDSTVTASDLTSEDLDLIETLWRQDIDLGIGKEVFDLNLRRELEREREIELQKQREKQKELELLQYKLEQERRQQAQNWLTENYVQDGETGEWIAVNNSVSGTHPLLSINSTEDQSQTFSFEEAFRILDGAAPISNETIAELDEYIGNVTNNISNGYVPSLSATQAQIESLIETAETFSETSGQEQDENRPVSLEQRWQDLVSVLNLTGSANTNSEPMDTAEPEPVINMPAEQSSVLLQNATMPQSMVNSSVGISTFQNTTFNDAYTSTTVADPYTNSTVADPYTNTAVAQPGVTSPVVWNTGDMLFPNMTTPMNQTDMLDGVDDLLPDLLAEAELDNISLDVDDMELTDSLQCLQMADDASSDSAVSSMGSSASPVQDLNETSAYESLSPFDGVEGATGGTAFASPSGNSKLGKYDPDDYNYNYSPYDAGDFNGEANYSSSSNDSQRFQSPNLDPVQHNHTYPLQPGAQRKDVGKVTSSKPRQKGPHSRDEKRAREMKLPMSVSTIIGVPVDEFNELLSKYKLTEPQLQLIRDIRRRGKNKVAAQNCRKRKLDTILTLEDELNNLKASRDKLLRERYLIDKQTRDMKGKFNKLYQEVFQSLRDDHGQPYDPNEFSLQETSDGNVFLVPRNVTTDQPQRKDPDRKRKEKK